MDRQITDLRGSVSHDEFNAAIQRLTKRIEALEAHPVPTTKAAAAERPKDDSYHPSQHEQAPKK